MKQLPCRKRQIAVVGAFCVVFSLGCTSNGNYSLGAAPTASPDRFRRVDVQEVTVSGATTHVISPETQTFLRTAIIEAIQDQEMYLEVGSALDAQSDVMAISCGIREFNRGSQFGRWLLGGFGVGRGHLDVDCEFRDSSQRAVFASGTFTGQIKGGFLGGSINEESLSEYVAEQVGKFLKKGSD